jgi:ankyrin repeat protein
LLIETITSTLSYSLLAAMPPMAAVAAADGRTPLHVAAVKGQTAAASNLIASGAAVDAADELGRTPLHEAVANGRTAVVAALIDAGAALDAADESGRTPLHEVPADSSRSVKLLVAAGASVSAADKEGRTPLHACHSQESLYPNKGALPERVDTSRPVNSSSEAAAQSWCLSSSGRQ